MESLLYFSRGATFILLIQMLKSSASSLQHRKGSRYPLSNSVS